MEEAEETDIIIPIRGSFLFSFFPFFFFGVWRGEGGEGSDDV